MKGHVWFRKNDDDEWHDLGESEWTYELRLIKFNELLIVCSNRIHPIDFTLNGRDFKLPLMDIWIPLWMRTE